MPTDGPYIIPITSTIVGSDPQSVIAYLKANGGGVSIDTLPTTLPDKPGVLWNNGGLLSFS